MQIAVDVMGGDHAPTEIIKGVIEAIPEVKGRIILVGPTEIIKNELANYDYNNDKLEVVEAPDIIEMEEEPARAVRKKKDSSIVVGANLVRRGKADALVSAGSTGAMMAAGLLKIGRVKGVKRPAIATVMPALEGETLVLDVGANVDSKPINLAQYALMGSIYAEQILHKKEPKVGLLSVGEEEKKGNDLTKEAHQLLKELDINFIGNVEGRDIFSGDCDLIVCDGFIGNIVLKTAEGLGNALFTMLKSELEESVIAKAGAFLMKSGLKNLKKKMDYAEYGGAPLLGVNGVVIISHGSSKGKAIKNAINVAQEAIEKQVVQRIKENIKRKE
ncbi:MULTISPECIES: phosphate acyltransferase PlsX [unclassified Candidatus Frackibacter]|uniref:phosphate acyltransferase PlsX n=1 Tax=unclassified Candidatus Frackibacter TaxID=2648818 RepID=UPI0007927DC6|nr:MULTISPECIES: phosphate acyltransferase PlsX [unclassified Candidatus Frackibacter]KXS44700.1 MAG: glycerol-3-phosphate acyltransferase PlsX [Candidatus Frackibacter sp. T328-2]SDC51669.1 phosphate:acyl-[acyl carrier protein] acyltransferase [Candidatus Frackibacter sp. WG11]SEM41107.1 phosphate:acyl-[acyl carrier protein] acyltransferase [Candidatus Frackibacter sp. WG12]SFL75674.1 phosphate:acyl-[acyl carrier protein] acyltransferase [Candidatus Frackibacter sp. WG13]